MVKTGNKPVHEVRPWLPAGRYRKVKAAIWLNQTAKGTMHNVFPARPDGSELAAWERGRQRRHGASQAVEFKHRCFSARPRRGPCHEQWASRLDPTHLS
jgi:hypothetical protein